MTDRNITPDMIRAGSTFECFNLIGGQSLGKRIVVSMGGGQFILITENFMPGLCYGYSAESLADEMTRLKAFEFVALC